MDCPSQSEISPNLPGKESALEREAQMSTSELLPGKPTFTSEAEGVTSVMEEAPRQDEAAPASINKVSRAKMLIRKCSRCTGEPKLDESKKDTFDENLAESMGYEDVCQKEKIEGCPFGAILYHQGQIDLLKWKIKNRPKPGLVKYYTASTFFHDAEYLLDLLIQEEVEPLPYSSEGYKEMILLRGDAGLLVPIPIDSCPLKEGDTNYHLFQTYNSIWGNFDFEVEKQVKHYREHKDWIWEEDFLIVPAVISLDQNEQRPTTRFCTICIQIHEPYSIIDLAKTIGHHYYPHILDHILTDMYLNYPILISHIVAFTIMYRGRKSSKSKLISDYEYLQSFKALKLNCVYEGKPKSIVEMGLIMLKDYITLNSNDTYTVKNEKAIILYAQKLLPRVAPLSMMARALLNGDCCNPCVFRFNAVVKVRQRKDKVLRSFINLAKNYKDQIYFLKPCIKMEDFAESTLRYFSASTVFFRLNLPVPFKCSVEHEGRFMLRCELCQGKFHGRCIRVDQNDAANLKSYFCIWCREKDPKLSETMFEGIVEEHKLKLTRLPQTICAYSSAKTSDDQAGAEGLNGKLTFVDDEVPDETTPAEDWVYVTRSLPHIRRMIRFVQALTGKQKSILNPTR